MIIDCIQLQLFTHCYAEVFQVELYNAAVHINRSYRTLTDAHPRWLAPLLPLCQWPTSSEGFFSARAHPVWAIEGIYDQASSCYYLVQSQRVIVRLQI